jgi:hypothetical protein
MDMEGFWPVDNYRIIAVSKNLAFKANLVQNRRGVPAPIAAVFDLGSGS